MVHHDGAEDGIKRLIAEGQTLDHADLEINWQLAPSRVIASAGDLLRAWINAEHMTRCANTSLDFNRQRSCTAAHIQHRLASAKTGQISSLLPKLPQLAPKQESVHEPFHQVIAPTAIEDQSSCRFDRCLT